MGNVTAVVTAMTDGERPYLSACLNAIFSEPEITRVIICIQESNPWLGEVMEVIDQRATVEVLRLPMMGPGGVRSAAVNHVDTEWVAFCDGDDVWCKHKTALQLAHAAKHQADFVAGDHYLTDEHGHIRAVAMAKYLPMTSSWMVRTSTMRAHPFKDVQWEDHEWWFRTKGKFKRTRCPRLLLKYRVRGTSLSTTEPSKERKARVVALGSKPVIGFGVLFLTAGLWLVNRSNSYRPLLK